jgi:hypothetical protein
LEFVLNKLTFPSGKYTITELFTVGKFTLLESAINKYWLALIVTFGITIFLTVPLDEVFFIFHPLIVRL